MPTFSIITINFNDAIGLSKTIESVLSQSFTDYEYIIIDGGSTDGSVDVIKRHAEQLTYWVSEKDAGVYDAMNKGIVAAKGDYLLFLNSGDYLHSNDVLKRISENNSNIDLIYGDIILAQNSVIVGKKISPDKISRVFLYWDCIGHQAQFIKRVLFEKYGNYSLEYKICADYEFFLRVFLKYRISTKHISIPVSVYDISGMSGNPANREKLIREYKLIHKIYFSRLILMLFIGYEAMLRSRVMRYSVVSIPIKYLNKIIVKYFLVKKV